MVRMPVRCPHCHSDHIITGGQTTTGQQRSKCAPPDCPRDALQLALTSKGRLPAINEHIVAMRLHGSGIRDTVRVLKISPTTVMHEWKKASALIRVNAPLLHTLSSSEVEVVSQRADEAEGDAMWASIGKKKEQRWLWHAIDHGNDQVWASVFARHTAAPRRRCAQSRQEEHVADQAQTLDGADPDHAVNPRDEVLFPIDPEA